MIFAIQKVKFAKSELKLQVLNFSKWTILEGSLSKH